MDLDGDGHIDLISGSWPGEIFFFRGGPKRTFAAPVKLTRKITSTIGIADVVLLKRSGSEVEPLASGLSWWSAGRSRSIRSISLRPRSERGDITPTTNIARPIRSEGRLEAKPELYLDNPAR